MKKIFTLIFIGLISIIFIRVSIKPALARDFPQSIGHVNDLANIISPAVEAALEDELVAFEASSSHELVVVTLTSLEEDIIENVAVDLFEQWGIGKADQDNGVLLLIAVEDRKMKIEVGYGLEPVLTDSQSGYIIRTYIFPAFKQEDYDAGITAGVKAIKQAITQDPAAFDSAKDLAINNDNGFNILIFAAVLILIYATSFLSRSKRFWPGGIIGAVIGFIFAGFIGVILLSLWGLFLDYILSKNYKIRKTRGLPTSWKSSRGGFWTGGSSSSGGFGGFGGGSSGGGGASGSW